MIRIANVFDPATRKVSAMDATRWSPAHEARVLDAARDAGFMVTFSYKGR